MNEKQKEECLDQLEEYEIFKNGSNKIERKGYPYDPPTPPTESTDDDILGRIEQLIKNKRAKRTKIGVIINFILNIPSTIKIIFIIIKDLFIHRKYFKEVEANRERKLTLKEKLAFIIWLHSYVDTEETLLGIHDNED